MVQSIADGIDAGLLPHNRPSRAPAPFGKAMIGRRGTAAPHPLDDRAHRRDRPSLETLVVEHARPAVEYLHDIGAGLELRDQIVATRLRPGCRSGAWNRAGSLQRQSPRRQLIGVPRPAIM